MDIDGMMCPGCKADLVASAIPEEYLLAGYYGPWKLGDPPKFYYRVIGVEIPGVYDGCLYWQCPDCGHRWHRWPEGNPLRQAAEDYVSGPLSARWHGHAA